MSVTSLGAHRIDAFTPLLDLPQSAILGVGRAGGEPAAAFLDQVIALLEEPSRLA